MSWSGNGDWGDMVGYVVRRVPRERPSKDQRKFLEILRDLGPRDNAQTATIRKITKRACHVRGWVEWRCIDQRPGVRAWHLTLTGRNALNSLMRKQSSLPTVKSPAHEASHSAAQSRGGHGGTQPVRPDEEPRSSL
jgi:hypothetical protein